MSALLFAGAAFVAAIALLSLGALAGWRGWLELKRIELGVTGRPGLARRDLTELRERIRHLEAIAAGTER